MFPIRKLLATPPFYFTSCSSLTTSSLSLFIPSMSNNLQFLQITQSALHFQIFILKELFSLEDTLSPCLPGTYPLILQHSLILSSVKQFLTIPTKSLSFTHLCPHTNLHSLSQHIQKFTTLYLTYVYLFLLDRKLAKILPHSFLYSPKFVKCLTHSFVRLSQSRIYHM